MTRFVTEPPFRHDTPSRTGVLLINLGTPAAPTAAALRPYLKQFLSDPRVVEIPRLVWWPILNGIILNTRPKKSAEKYASVWTPDGSPLLVHTLKQTKLLRGWLGEQGLGGVVVEVAMRYGEPSVSKAIESLRQQGCERLLVVPLYPQYAASSSASAVDAVLADLQQRRNMPELRTVKSFHDDPGYIAALADSVRRHWAKNGRGDHLLMSFHGVPRFSLDKGDPYHCHCHKTARLLGEALGLDKDQYTLSFQSRFGRAEWLKPYTTEALHQLGKRGVEKLDVICPGFVADCLETLEEIAMEGKADFIGAGGREYRYISCLNEDDAWIAALGQLVTHHLHGWIAAEGDLEQRSLRARALGAKQ